MTLALIFLAGLALSVGAFGLAAAALRAHRRLSRGAAVPGFAPSVSIVKPLSGLDEGLEENLESFYRLEYPDYEILFSFARREDAAFAVARRVADRHPEVPTAFVVDASEPGANAKVNRLTAGVRHARGRLFLFSDGNVRVAPAFLERAVGAFADPRVGLVSHLFRASGARSLASRLESLHLNGCLQAGTAAVARLLGMPCVVGKSILISRAAFRAIGGLEPLRDFLAEDYLLGRLVSRAGFRVVLCGDEVETSEVAKSLPVVWGRHRRWAILRQRLAGAAYWGELFASPAPWFAGAVLASGGDARILAAAGLLGLLRGAIEAACAADAGRPLSAVDFALLPVRDVLVAGVFWAGLFGRRTAWRGRRMTVGAGTLLLQR